MIPCNPQLAGSGVTRALGSPYDYTRAAQHTNSVAGRVVTRSLAALLTLNRRGQGMQTKIEGAKACKLGVWSEAEALPLHRSTAASHNHSLTCSVSGGGASAATLLARRWLGWRADGTCAALRCGNQAAAVLAIRGLRWY